MTAPLFDVKFSAEGICVGKLRNEVTLTATEPFQVSRMLATDEGKFQGGDDTSPTPLEFFLTGWVGCLMTQIRVFAKRMKIEIEDVEVVCRAHWEAVSTTEGPYRGQPVGFEVDIDIKSNSERVDELINAARGGCFVEQTLNRANEISHRLRINEEPWAVLEKQQN